MEFIYWIAKQVISKHLKFFFTKHDIHQVRCGSIANHLQPICFGVVFLILNETGHSFVVSTSFGYFSIEEKTFIQIELLFYIIVQLN